MKSLVSDILLQLYLLFLFSKDYSNSTFSDKASNSLIEKPSFSNSSSKEIDLFLVLSSASLASSIFSIFSRNLSSLRIFSWVFLYSCIEITTAVGWLFFKTIYSLLFSATSEKIFPAFPWLKSDIDISLSVKSAPEETNAGESVTLSLTVTGKKTSYAKLNITFNYDNEYLQLVGFELGSDSSCSYSSDMISCTNEGANIVYPVFVIKKTFIKETFYETCL